MGPYLSNLPHPAAHARTRHRSAPVVMALVAMLSQTQADTDSGACAPASSAAGTLIIGTDAPVVDTASTNRIVDTAQLSLVSADAGRLRLHPGQAPPSA